MDNFWVKKWRDQVKKKKIIMVFLWFFILIPAIILCILSIKISDDLLTWFGIYVFCLCIPYLVFVLIALLCIKIKTRIINDSIILFYAGILHCILIIDGKEFDRCLGNDYLYGQLPDGRQVCAKYGSWTGSIKITISEKGSDLNIML